MLNKKIVLYPNITPALGLSVLTYIGQNQEYLVALKYGRHDGILLDFGSNNIVLLYNTKTSIIAVKGEG